MKILVTGSGAREHALALALHSDPSVQELHAAPGNPGIAALASVHSFVDGHPFDASSPEDTAGLASDLGVDLVVIGPEIPLVAGVADTVRASGIACFGPSRAAAHLEGSKAFAKEVMASAEVPTARSYVCANASEAADALDAFGPPYVVKADGLAAGKGVVVTESLDDALIHAVRCFEAGRHARVVIEEFLDGPEVSLFCLSDGVSIVPLAPAQDFKRAGDGDTGPNTGGMGAYSPLPWAPEGLVQEVVDRVALPVIQEMARRGMPFVGLLYCGLAMTSRGMRVIEFNVRFGDPETQVVLARLKTPLAPVLNAAATGTLHEVPPLRWSEHSAVTVVLASEGYPATPRLGDTINGLAAANGVEGVRVLHAGTAYAPEPIDSSIAVNPTSDVGASACAVVSSGGRVVSVVGLGKDLSEARERAYAGVAHIDLPGSHYRSDIAAAESLHGIGL